MQYNHKSTFYDIIIIASILIVAILSYVIINYNTWKAPGNMIKVRQYGEVVFQLSEQELNKDGIYEFEFDKGIGQIEVKDKQVRVLPMDRKICPEKICSDTGWIDRKPETIICMPNQLIVSFEGYENSEVDAII